VRSSFLVLLVAVLAAVPPAGRLSPHDGPLSAPTRLYVEPRGAAVEQVRAFEAAGRAADAALIRRIADRPAAAWFADEAPGYAARARDLAVNAAAVGRLPVLVLYHIPHRDCAGQSAGGAASAEAYAAWVSALSKALAGRRAIVILEPDAVAQAVQGCLPAAPRYALLSNAIRTLSANPGLRIYLDAGNSAWITDTELMSRALKKAGIARADGFALNVANFETTKATIAYGSRLSKMLSRAHFIIDTSRNGNGPAAKGHHHWCNPPGRALGEPPTLTTGRPLVDAYLWVKRPGESDGACGNGAPPAGSWWPAYALALARG
jgi:endoglucanase